MRTRNKKGQFTKKVDIYKLVLIFVLLLGATLFVCFDVTIKIPDKSNDNSASFIDTVFAKDINPTITETPTVTTTPVFIKPSEQVKNHETSNSKNLTIQDKIKLLFGKDSRIALAIATAESHFDCKAVNINKNQSIDLGVFQINSIQTKRIQKHGWVFNDMKDCDKNLEIAHEIFIEQGWNPWSSYKSGVYKNYL